MYIDCERMLEAIPMSRLQMIEEQAQKSVNKILSSLCMPKLIVHDTSDEQLHQTLLLLLEQSFLPSLGRIERERLACARRDISMVLLTREGYDLKRVPKQ